MLELNKIYNMDCVEGMKLLPNECIDLTVTSPPYDNLRTYKGFTWDFEATAKELYRVTKEGGVVVWIVGDATIKGSETGTSFRQALYFKEIGFNLHDTMIYAKNNPIPMVNHKRYQQQFEYMFIFSKSTPSTFNGRKRDRKYFDSRQTKTYNRNNDGLHVKGSPSHSKKVLDNNIWFYTIGGGHVTADKIAYGHPAIFPEQLANDHILSWSNEGDLVLDPFMGSGTTAKMALLNNRHFIGFEISKEYCKIANKRIESSIKETSLLDWLDEFIRGEIMIHVFDVEVFAYDWIVIFKDVASGEYTIIHNDNEAVKQFMANDPILGGFNNKWYDNHILKAILADADNSIVKEINDFIIGGGNGWEHSWFSQQRGIWFNSFDLFDDVQQGLSLKAIEAHLGLPIEESEVDFNIDRPLTPEELQQTVDYCKYDVDVTEKLLTIRKDYLQGKLALARMRDIPEERALYCTNAKMVALFLGATKQDRDDERQYKIPENLKLEFIPQEVKDFFGKMSDMKIPDDVLFKSKLNIHIGNCPTQYGFGGVHGSLTGYFEQATSERSIQNRDVSSMYPTLMIQYGYASRNIPSFDIYKDVYERRMKAKQDGDKAVDRTLKLVLNTKFGGMGSKYNDLYDPLMCRSVCITGQLFLTSLAVELYEKCPSLKLLNLNTDGIMYSVDNSELPKVEEICKAWEENSRMSLETDDIDRVWIKDVNNLMFIDKSGSIKKAGGYLNHGISVKSAWNINNNHTIVKDAVVEFFSKGTPVEETIGNCNDPLAFQIIAKASGLYSGAFHIIDGEKVPVQKCNRVYATKNIRYGTLIKTHATRKTDAKIGGLPEHCIIDNNNEISISDIDKDWYIKLAKKYINDYLGIKPPKKNTRKINSLKKQILKILED